MRYLKATGIPALGLLTVWMIMASAAVRAAAAAYQVKPVSAEQAAEYKLDVGFYKKCTLVQNILIHEFAHVIDGVGFDTTLHERLNAAFQHAKDKGLYNDGYAAQKFRRVTSVEPVGLLESLVKAFPAQPPAFLTQCLDGGDILVNGKPSRADVKVTRDDKVLIVFGGPKPTYARLNAATG